jgi:hypothetical protein
VTTALASSHAFALGQWIAEVPVQQSASKPTDNRTPPQRAAADHWPDLTWLALPSSRDSRHVSAAKIHVEKPFEFPLIQFYQHESQDVANGRWNRRCRSFMRHVR